MKNPVGTSKKMDPIGRVVSDLVAQDASTVVHGDKTGLSIPSYVAVVPPMNQVTSPIQVSGKPDQEIEFALGAHFKIEASGEPRKAIPDSVILQMEVGKSFVPRKSRVDAPKKSQLDPMPHKTLMAKNGDDGSQVSSSIKDQSHESMQVEITTQPSSKVIDHFNPMEEAAITREEN